MELGGKSVKEGLGRGGIAAALEAELIRAGTGWPRIQVVAHHGDACEGGVSAHLMRAGKSCAGFPKTPCSRIGESGEMGGAFFALGGGGNHLGLGVVRQEGCVHEAGLGTPVLAGEEMDAGFDSPVAVLLAKASDGGTVQAEECHPADFRIEGVDRTEAGRPEPQEFRFPVFELFIEGVVEVGKVEAPGMLAHRDPGGFGKGKPVVRASQDGQAEGFRPEEGWRKTEGRGGGGIVRHRTQASYRATKKPRFGKRIRGQWRCRRDQQWLRLGGSEVRATCLVTGNLICVHQTGFAGFVQGGDIAFGRFDKGVLVTGFGGSGHSLGKGLEATLDLTVLKRAGLGLANVFLS